MGEENVHDIIKEKLVQCASAWGAHASVSGG